MALKYAKWEYFMVRADRRSKVWNELFAILGSESAAVAEWHSKQCSDSEDPVLCEQIGILSKKPWLFESEVRKLCDTGRIEMRIGRMY